MQTTTTTPLSFTTEVASFFEVYDLSDHAATAVTGVYPIKEEIALKIQGALQYVDENFIVLDFNSGMLFFVKKSEETATLPPPSNN